MAVRESAVGAWPSTVVLTSDHREKLRSTIDAFKMFITNLDRNGLRRRLLIASMAICLHSGRFGAQACNLKRFVSHAQCSLNSISGKWHLLACTLLAHHKVALLPNEQFLSACGWLRPAPASRLELSELLQEKQ